jgi:hypothetical protein
VKNETRRGAEIETGNRREAAVTTRFAALRGNALTQNTPFDRHSAANRDDCFAPYILLREKLLVAGFHLDTADQASGESLAFELHQDVQRESGTALNYLLMLENELIMRDNGKPANWNKYRKIFTWNDLLVDGERFIKINFPNPIVVHAADGYSTRDRFCCLIAGNKSLSLEDSRNLYPERVKVIRWFEANASQDFDLYGVGWDLPEAVGGVLGKVQRHLWQALGRVVKLRPFPSYRGKVAHKREVLTRTRFAICYENVSDLPGYITEKIFDCFFAGCVPVYWGADNVSDHIPHDCFIDRRSFPDIESVYHFLKAMPEDKFIGYQRRIAAFLQSDAGYKFGSEFFANTIVKTIVQDHGN